MTGQTALTAANNRHQDDTGKLAALWNGPHTGSPRMFAHSGGSNLSGFLNALIEKKEMTQTTTDNWHMFTFFKDATTCSSSAAML